MERIFNFSAGPSMLPISVLKEAQKQMLNYNNSGMSVMEMSHRSKVYEEIINGAENVLRDIMAIPEDYSVLFLQGGASSQFAMVPLNLYSESKTADYVNTGTWAIKAIKEAKRYGTVNVVATSEDTNYNRIPDLDKSKFNSMADYFHITTNNTIEGTRFTEIPDTGDIPIVADMSSNILSEVYDVSKFGLIFAGAQKNMGPAGVTLAIIRKDLLGKALDITPTMFNYKTHADENSMFNTPPAFGIYICKLVFEWVREMGGVAALQRINEEKARILYDYLDESKMFRGTVEKKDRSLMNIPFVSPSAELDAKFLKEATLNGLVELKGHRSVGGMRASIYNAMPTEGVIKLVSFMKKFEAEN
ncbi:MAG TPA: 3-phosphoserine/phosphohydroxythreonine transaminase [Anaerovoracaceae bacterium]|nr:3-phosphoserine/phosphohydroxythreonine transaminase [Anaerovoracaceae bacterium]